MVVCGEDMGFEPTPLDIGSPSTYCPNILLPNIQMKYFMCLQREWE